MLRNEDYYAIQYAYQADFLYIAVAIVSFIAVTTICYKHDYNKVYNYYSDALYQQATEISSEYGTDFP